MRRTVDWIKSGCLGVTTVCMMRPYIASYYQRKTTANIVYFILAEFMYQVLKNHPGCTLPKEALWCVRYHSFYPWHDDGDYMDLCAPEDVEVMKWVKDFK